MVNLLIKKALNNNVLIAEHPSYEEVVLIGKGIGFNRKRGDYIDADEVEKVFVLKDQKEQTNYLKLISQVDNDMLEVIISAIELIKKKTDAVLNEHIHVSLTDHIVVAASRIANGMVLNNPFLVETKTLYPFEYQIAEEVVALIKEKTGLYLPVGEVGFITLHIHSAVMNKSLTEVNKYSQLVSRLIHLIEEQLHIQIDKESIDYMRLVRHLRFTIERVVSGEKVEESENITLLLKHEYPMCYNLAWKLIKVMQQNLKKTVYEAEAVYLTMHLQRLQKKIK